MFKRYPCVKQQDITDCGAACIATVARAYGLKVPIARIRQYAGTDQHGTTVMGMVEAGQQLGFQARGVKSTEAGLAQVPLPCIAHVLVGDMFHYLVIHRVRAGYVTAADPARGIVRFKRSAFTPIWTGILILLSPAGAFRKGNHATGLWFRFARLLVAQRTLLLETLLATIFITLLGLGTSFYLQMLVDRVLVEKDWALLRLLSAGILALVLFRAAFGFVRGQLLAAISRKVDLSLILDYYRHVLRLPMQFFETRRTGEIISRLHDAVKIREVISGPTLGLLVDMGTAVGGFGILSLYSSKLTLSALMLVPFMALVVCLINRPLRRAQRASMEEAAVLQSYLFESLAGVSTIKAFGAEAEASKVAEDKVLLLLRNLFRANSWAVSSSAAGELITAIGSVGILWLSGSMVILGEMTVGRMVAFHSILLYTIQPMYRLVAVAQTIQDAVVAADRLGEILDQEAEPTGGSKRVALRAGRPEKVEFRNVGFRYGKRAQVLHDVTLSMPPGSIIALIGESGSGKTTLAKLLLRFHEPSAGCIEIGGCDVRDIPLDALRSCIGYVDQEVCFFSGTIEENLKLGNPGATDESVVRAASAAGLDSLIAGLPEGYRTRIGERGLTLSGGQRQRLAIARALVRDPRILILDEATSNLDLSSELEIQKTILKLKREKTIILIAHRLSAVAVADRIAVLDRGRVIEQGTHRQLIEVGGTYSKLWRTWQPGELQYAGGRDPS